MASTFASNLSSLQTPIFIGKNYEYWSLTMKPLFKGQSVQKIIQYGYAEPTYKNITQAGKDDLREQRTKDGKSLFYIHQAMHESILPRVAIENNPKRSLNTLETTYQGFGKVNTSKLQILRRYSSMVIQNQEI